MSKKVSCCIFSWNPCIWLVLGKSSSLSTGQLVVNVIPNRLLVFASRSHLPSSHFHRNNPNQRSRDYTLRRILIILRQVAFPCIAVPILREKGDLIALSDTDPLGEFVRAKSGKHWSHLGIALRIPNPVTTILELFVIEVTQNQHNFLDAIHDVPVNGVTIFRCGCSDHEFLWVLALRNESINFLEQLFVIIP